MSPLKMITGPLLACLLVSACERSPAPEQNAGPADDATAVIEAAVAPRQLTGEQLFLVCMGCHSLHADSPHKVGPNLYGLKGRKGGSLPDFVYSEALKAAGETWLVWEKGTLMGFIVNSEAMVPDTWMLFHSVLTMPETERLADYILDQGAAGTPE